MKFSTFKMLLLLTSSYYTLLLPQSKNNYDLILEVNKNMPKYGFILQEIKNELDYRSYMINVYRSDSDSLVQIIDLSEYNYWYSEYDYPYIDSLIDVNFDSYKDLCVVTAIGQNGKNWGYNIFIFNETARIFQRNENFPTIYNFYTNDSLKQIYESFWNCGGEECIVYKTYLFQDNKLVLIQQDYQDFDNELNKWRRFVEHYENGKLIYKEETEPREE